MPILPETGVLDLAQEVESWGDPRLRYRSLVIPGLRSIIAQTKRRASMTICPIALAVGCKKCPIVKICPAKEIIGNYKREDTGDKK